MFVIVSIVIICPIDSCTSCTSNWHGLEVHDVLIAISIKCCNLYMHAFIAGDHEASIPPPGLP